MPPLLELRDLTITAAGTLLHSQISLSVQPGELVAVTGPSGAGKTTLLRTVCGLQDPAGTVLLEGKNGDAWGWPVLRRKVVLVSQKPALFALTVEDNLRRPFLYKSAAQTPFPAEAARRLLDELGVGTSCWEQDAQTLSVGQQQRVSLIRALLLEPLVLCLDEPTSALDPDSAGRVQSLISRLAAERGLAALIVTHSPEQAEHWCTRRLVLPGRD